jgi:hypothetical protein
MPRGNAYEFVRMPEVSSGGRKMTGKTKDEILLDHNRDGLIAADF